MGGFTFIAVIMLFSSMFHTLIPLPYTVDLFLICAVYISLTSNREQTLFIVWGLGILKGIFSCSPFVFLSVNGYEQEAVAALYTFPPIAFILIYLILNSVRTRLMSTHPLTQFLAVSIISVVYSFFDIFFNLSPVPLIDRVFLYWPSIILIALINGLAAVIFFRILSRVPIRVVSETRRGDF